MGEAAKKALRLGVFAPLDPGDGERLRDLAVPTRRRTAAGIAAGPTLHLDLLRALAKPHP